MTDVIVTAGPAGAVDMDVTVVPGSVVVEYEVTGASVKVVIDAKSEVIVSVSVFTVASNVRQQIFIDISEQKSREAGINSAPKALLISAPSKGSAIETCITNWCLAMQLLCMISWIA